MSKSITYSQNFLTNESLVTQLLDNSTLNKKDTVYEIGAGDGIITSELVRRVKKVVAFELDKNLLHNLKRRFKRRNNLTLLNKNFLNYPLPSDSYKVFSNIPYNITSAILKKLTQLKNPPAFSYLIVQKEAVQRFVGKPYDKMNSQISILIKPWFDLQVVHKFKRIDFSPNPGVDSVLLKIEKRVNPHVELKHAINYQDFVVYTYNRFRPNVVDALMSVFGEKRITRLLTRLNTHVNTKPSELNYENWPVLFKEFLKLSTDKRFLVKGSYVKLLKQQSELKKIHRTRRDKNWRRK